MVQITKNVYQQEVSPSLRREWIEIRLTKATRLTKAVSLLAEGVD